MSTPDTSSFRPLVNRALRVSRRAINGLARRKKQGPFRGYLDEITPDGMLRGWVVDRRSGKGRVPVALFAGDELIEIGYANGIREDVRSTTGGEVECGFHFPLSEAIYARIMAADGQLSVRTHGGENHEIGSMTLTVDRSDPKLAKDDISACRIALATEYDLLLELLDDTPDPAGTLPPVTQPPFTRHKLMFSTDPLIPGVPVSGHPAYLDYVRYRYRMDESYEVEPGLESKDRFLYWYLTAYRSQEKRRVPLSREILDYLNEPIVMAGQLFSLSRIMWWRMAGRPDMMGTINLNDRDSYLNTLFWWAHLDSPHMYFEDCLIPDRFADLLRGVHPSRRLDAYPLSYFTERYFQNSPRLHFLRPGTAEGRKTLVLAMLLAAVQRPDLLRYIPRGAINKLLEPGEDGQSEFERFLNDMRRRDEIAAAEAAEAEGTESTESTEGTEAEGDTEAGTETATGTDTGAIAVRPQGPLRLSRERYGALLRKRDFDLESYRFMTRDRDGNRFEAAAMQIPAPDRPEVDVQMIGPLAKASGLGQATRLSAAILRETGLSIRGVDFDLDNPAPEGFSSDTLIEDYGPAKINLIHLNAESTPLAYAYQPDVFSDTYTIGYFFWELDKPAFCHYLGMELLDEIWVSTEYGVEIYKPDAKGKPVINVGMCYEDNTDITRAESRAFVNRRFQLDESHYVCLVAFDSFSFVQRKNPVSVLLAFQKAFEGVKEARLVVKTQNRDSVFDPVQVQLWDRVDAIMSEDPRIMVMNETLSYRDLLQLKCGSDCYVSLHKSEGWGFGMIEAMNLRVPVVCTAYSGNMDFCSHDTAWLVEYEERQLRHGEYIFVRPGSKWAEPSIDHAARQLRAAYDDPAARAARADAAYDYIRANFSVQAIGKRYGDRLREILDSGSEKAMKRSIKIGDKTREVSSDDNYLANMGGEFEPDMTALFKGLIDPGMVVADVGANIGMTALLFSDLAKHVYAFEPGVSIFKILSGNVTGIDNIEPVNVGMGDRGGEQTLTFMKANRSGGWVGDSIKLENQDYTTETIRIETLDTFFFDDRPRPDFIKMDVEGFEPAVLRGGHALLARKKPTVVLELNHFCLNVVHGVTLPEFFTQLRALFPVLLAVDNGNRQLANLHEPDAAYMVMHDHATQFRFPNIVAGFDDSLHKRMQTVAAQTQQGA